MKQIFMLATAAVLFGTGIVGCSNTAEGVKDDAAQNTAAVQKAGAVAVDKTVEGTKAAGDAVAKGAVETGAAVQKGAAEAGAAVQKGAAEAGAAVEKGAAEVQKGAAEAGQVATHTGKVMTVTPTVKAALLKDETLYPSSNPSLNSINVDTGSDGQTIVLKGTVQTNDMKKHAEEVAKKASPDGSYKIDNQLTVAKH